MVNSRSNIDFQAIPPANAIFAGIGVLLLVSVLRFSLRDLSETPYARRRLKTRALAETSL